ncbi:MAG: hypothetical protein WCX90_09230 [Thiohalomonadaceae bacterium]
MEKQISTEFWLWGGVVVMALLVAGVFVYKFSASEEDLPVISADLSACDLQQGSCLVSMDGLGSFTVTITPRPIPLVETLNFIVETDVPDLHQVEIDFSGVDMNMGYNRFKLKSRGNGRYTGEGMLPVCVRNRMTWEAKVMLYRTDAVYVAPFNFDTFTRR